jgi:hypothetical protein
MRQLFALIAVTVVIASLAMVPVTYGQDRPAPAPGQERAAAAKTFTGQLSKIDASAKTLLVKGPDDKEMTFSYTDQTQVVGGENGVQGLDGKTGTMLRVTYREDKGTNIATRIEVAQSK